MLRVRPLRPLWQNSADTIDYKQAVTQESPTAWGGGAVGRGIEPGPSMSACMSNKLSSLASNCTVTPSSVAGGDSFGDVPQPVALG